MEDPDGNIVIDRLAASIDEKSPASKSEHNLFVGSSEIWERTGRFTTEY